jgi:hypothetical protein
MLVSVGAEMPTLLQSGSAEAQGGMVGEAVRRLQRLGTTGETSLAHELYSLFLDLV